MWTGSVEESPNKQSSKVSESDGTVEADAPASASVDPSAGEDATPQPQAPAPISQADVDALLQQDGGATPDKPEAAEQAAVDGEDKGAADASGGGEASTGEAGAPQGPTSTHALELPELDAALNARVDPKRVSMLNDVNLRVRIELGRTRMLVEDVLALGEGSVVELDKLAGDPVDVYVNDRLIARGEILVLNDNFCVRISEVLSHDPHRVTA